jgi:hypothetical protein
MNDSGTPLQDPIADSCSSFNGSCAFNQAESDLQNQVTTPHVRIVTALWLTFTTRQSRPPEDHAHPQHLPSIVTTIESPSQSTHW